jgi:hypothetical protein
MFISHAFAQTASPDGGSGGVGLFILLIIVLVIVGVIIRTTIIIRAKRTAQRDEQDKFDKLIHQRQVIIKTYKGSQAEATARFQADSIEMAGLGYFPTAQSWAPGRWGAGAFIVALLLCFFIIGFLVFVYMLIVRPDGTLTVTYAWRTAAVEEKTCPKCAERIKAQALVCHFCGYEFAHAEDLRRRPSRGSS